MLKAQLVLRGLQALQVQRVLRVRQETGRPLKLLTQKLRLTPLFLVMWEKLFV